MKLLALVTLFLLAAGCTDQGEPRCLNVFGDRTEPCSPVSQPSDEPLEPVVTVLQLSGGVPLAVAGRPLVPPNPPVEEWALSFNVTNQTRLVRVTLAWNDPTGAQDLDAYASTDRSFVASEDAPESCNRPPFYPDCLGRYTNPNGTYGAPDNPSVLTLNEATLREVQSACGDPCAWHTLPWAKATYANVTWTITVALVDGPEPLPAGYALPPTLSA
jgi:hypothetical protein